MRVLCINYRLSYTPNLFFLAILNKVKIKKPLLLFVSILLSQLAGVIGSLATTSAISTWYVTLTKPVFNPPNWIFGPVWITLYTLMGIALYLIWSKDRKIPQVKTAINLFLVHLVVNSAWSIVFFGLKNLGLALVVILVLWLMIVVLIKLFSKLSLWASRLLWPYLLWVSFATLLNFSLWQLNM